MQTVSLKNDPSASSQRRAIEIFHSIGLDPDLLQRGDLAVKSPIDGREIARVHRYDERSTSGKIQSAASAFRVGRTMPAQRRGELIRLPGYVGIRKDLPGRAR